MGKVVKFFKGTRMVSRILFVLWIVLSVFAEFTNESKLEEMIDFAVIILVPVLLYELCVNPLVTGSNSFFCRFMKNTRIISRVLICGYAICNLLIVRSIGYCTGVLLIAAILFLVPVTVIECLFNPESIIRKMQIDEFVASQHNNLLKESLALMNTTLYPKTFFGRYKDSLFFAGNFLKHSHKRKYKKEVQDIMNDLVENRAVKVKDFIDRCYDCGKLYFIKDDLLSGKYDLSADEIYYVEQLLSLYNDVISPEGDEFIYCSVSFNADGKTYYYKTTDETLKCGDKVTVAVGKEDRLETATIEKIERFPVGKTPFPPRLTKDILGKTPF